jgi:hypothetical protein
MKKFAIQLGLLLCLVGSGLALASDSELTSEKKANDKAPVQITVDSFPKSTWSGGKIKFYSTSKLPSVSGLSKKEAEAKRKATVQATLHRGIEFLVNLMDFRPLVPSARVGRIAHYAPMFSSEGSKLSCDLYGAFSKSSVPAGVDVEKARGSCQEYNGQTFEDSARVMIAESIEGAKNTKERVNDRLEALAKSRERLEWFLTIGKGHSILGKPEWLVSGPEGDPAVLSKSFVPGEDSKTVSERDGDSGTKNSVHLEHSDASSMYVVSTPKVVMNIPNQTLQYLGVDVQTLGLQLKDGGTLAFLFPHKDLIGLLDSTAPGICGEALTRHFEKASSKLRAFDISLLAGDGSSSCADVTETCDEAADKKACEKELNRRRATPHWLEDLDLPAGRKAWIILALSLVEITPVREESQISFMFDIDWKSVVSAAKAESYEKYMAK